MHQVYQDWKLLFELLFAVSVRNGFIVNIPLCFYAAYFAEKRIARVPTHKQACSVANVEERQRKAA